MIRQEGSPMATKRGEERDFELRLGALQVVIWLGLAVGASVGAYFVGFLQGRGVGYEEGRAPSAVEVAKLSVTDAVPESGVVTDSAVFDRLNTSPPSPAASEPPQKKSAKLAEESVAAKVAQDIKLADEAARLSGDAKAELKVGDKGDSAVLGEGARGNAPKGSVDSFRSPGEVGAVDDGSEPDLFGSPEGDGGAPSHVRMLGTDPLADDTNKKDKDKTLGAILDERIESARGVGLRDVVDGGAEAKAPGVVAALENVPPTAVPTVRIAPPTTPPKQPTVAPKQPTVAPTKKPETTKSSTEVSVKKVLPAGYFAQVAAPTKLSDAESVARKLRQSGFPVVVEEAEIKGESYYRVLVGPEDNKVQADRLLEQLRSERYLTSAPFIRKVK